MKNDDVIKRYRSLFTSKEESNKTEGGAPFTDYWKTKEIEEFWLAEIKRAREECYEQMEGIIGEDDRGNSSHGNCCTCSGCRHYHDDCTCAENAVRADQRSKLQALKEEL